MSCEHEWDAFGLQCVRCKGLRARLEKSARREQGRSMSKPHGTFRREDPKNRCERCGRAECPLPVALANLVGKERVGPGVSWRDTNHAHAIVDRAMQLCGVAMRGERADRLIVDDPDAPTNASANTRNVMRWFEKGIVR